MRTAMLLVALMLPMAAAGIGDLSDPLDGTGLGASGPAFASPDQATIRPGVQMFTGGQQCTSNFVFTEGDAAYIGYAAHCAGLGEATDTNGCTAGTMPLGTRVDIDGAQHPGELVYSSWLAMQAAGEDAASDICAYNDFALVRIDARDVARTSPSVRHFGGPTALCSNPGAGSQVISYGNSGLRFGLDPIAPKTGMVLATAGSGWSSTVYMASPGIPGDSGSGYMDRDHCAWGVTSTLALAPYAASNGISSLSLGLQYAAAHGGPDAALATAAPITDLPV